MAPDPNRRMRLLYGSGSISFGIKDNGFNYLLLIYYNQVLGLPAATVGLVIMIALIVDGVADPVIGYLSDHTRSRWGRRHPWMYAAAVPCAVAYWLLWNPPAGLSDTQLTAWLLGIAIVVRLSIAAYEIPSASMVAELTTDYDERTRFLGWRFLFGWIGGIAAGVAAFRLFLTPTDAQPNGILNAGGYGDYGLVAALAMLAAILASSLGTHHAIPTLRAAPERRELSLAARVRETRDALNNRPFLSVLTAGMLAAMATGITTALNTYIQSYFWELSTRQIAWLVLAALAGAIVALPLSRKLARRHDKRRAAVIAYASALAVGPAPILLRLVGLFPGNGDAALMPLLLAHVAVLVGFFVAGQILLTSMLADTIEVNEARTGERTEGVYFAANFFVQKCVSGVGVFASGLLLRLIEFPEGARPGEVAGPVLERLALVYVPTVLVLYVAAIACLGAYRITRADHATRLRVLSGS